MSETVEVKKPGRKPKAYVETREEVAVGGYLDDSVEIEVQEEVPVSAVFVSKIRNLIITLYQESSTSDKMIPTQIQFNEGRIALNDKGKIAALRNHRSFGGSKASAYSDRPTGAKAPLFYEGDIPDDVRRASQVESDQLTREQGFYEPGGDK